MKKVLLVTLLSIVTIVILGFVTWFGFRYSTSKVMEVPVTEFKTFQYAEDPSNLSVDYQRYSDRKLTIVKNDDTHFDLILEPQNDSTAKIILKNIDLSLFVTSEPKWTKKDKNLELIAFTDREWNRQQARFYRNSPHVEIIGGDGFEKNHLFTVELAKNCLNAGLWEIFLTKGDNGQKAIYYHGWFNFPLGHYKNIFEKINKVSYWKYWWSLEHWVDPEGAPVNLKALRSIIDEKEVKAKFLADERIFAYGEQRRKRRTIQAQNLRTWKDFYDGRKIEFATFIPPGLYKVNVPWKNEFWRIARLKKAFIRNIDSPASSEILQEIELIFSDSKSGEENKLVISGMNLESLPQLPVWQYPKGLYKPMGIGVPSFSQNYEMYAKYPANLSPYFCLLLDSRNNWINHHDVAVDGPVLHKDEKNPNLLHLYLLSYERHSLVGHYTIEL
ncbi:MAG: hypothetical protein QNJ31_05720 [Candidatus Caenarcaniphilales bacterium]|nr:hypothetical protein [Candidatus Caenarcaniphilales bacterium]